MNLEPLRLRDGYLLDIECTNESDQKVCPYLVKKKGRATARRPPRFGSTLV